MTSGDPAPVAAESHAAFDALCNLARWCYGATAVSVALVGPDGLRFVAADDDSRASIVGARIEPGRGIAGLVAATGQSMTVRHLADDPRFARDVAESTGYIPDTIQCVPFRDADGEVDGVLSLLDRDDESAPRGAAPAPGIETFTTLAAAIGGGSNGTETVLGGLDDAERARALAILSNLVDVLRR